MTLLAAAACCHRPSKKRCACTGRVESAPLRGKTAYVAHSEDAAQHGAKLALVSGGNSHTMCTYDARPGPAGALTNPAHSTHDEAVQRAMAAHSQSAPSQISRIGLCPRPGADVHAEALVEHAGIHQDVSRRNTQRRGARGLGARLPRGCALRRHHLLHLRRELDHGLAAEKVVARAHPGPDALDDRLGGVIVMITVEVTAHAVLLRLRGHLHLNVHVVAPLVDAHLDAEGKLHVHNALLVALGNHVRNLPPDVIRQAEARAT